jgi:cytochrome P450
VRIKDTSPPGLGGSGRDVAGLSATRLGAIGLGATRLGATGLGASAFGGSSLPTGDLYRAPAPIPAALLGRPDGDLLGLLPRSLYRRDRFKLPLDDRDICLINEPAGIRQVLVTEEQNFPKSDVMIAALKPLLGDGILISNGPMWQRQRAMLEPALHQMGVRRQFPAMAAAVADFVRRLDALGPGAEINLDSEISLFALDVIFRTIFSRPIEVSEAREISRAFLVYQDRAPQFEALGSVFATRPSAEAMSDTALAEISERIRDVIERRISSAPTETLDILQTIMASRDPATGDGFSRSELVDHITVLFLAGHETSASALVWCIFLLSQRPGLVDRIRKEAEALAPGRPLTQQELNKLECLRNVFRETLRLYPPSAFITRMAQRQTNVGGLEVKAGDMVVISPWLVHRHLKYWQQPEFFDPDRFSAERERRIVPGTYLPFGLGPRVCTGRSFAMIEAPLLLVELIRRFTFVTIEPESVIPSYRLLVRPKQPIRCRIDPAPRH